MVRNELSEGGRVNGGPAIAAAGSIALLTFVIGVVNYWIYRARFQFIELHPAFSAEQPPTISKAITDPAIGEPFAFWITLSAAALAVGIIPICWMHHRTARALPVGRERTWLTRLAWVSFATQFAACIGMAMLANWRGPDHDAGHMIGSYVFFGGQTFTVLVAAIMARLIARNADATSASQVPGMLSPRLSHVRAMLGFGGVAVAAVFISLFVAKGFEFEYGYDAMYVLYVLSEPTLITYFLFVIVTYFPELWSAARSFSGSSRPLLSASRTLD